MRLSCLSFIFLILGILAATYGCQVPPILEEKTAKINIGNTPAQIGNKAGNTPSPFNITDIEGNKISLEEFTNSGRPVLLYFYATWCPYCHADFAELSRVYANYESNITIIAISLDTYETKNTIKDYQSRFPQLAGIHFAAANEKILVDYGIIHTTTKYAIKEGKIIYAGSGVFSKKHWNLLLSEMSRK